MNYEYYTDYRVYVMIVESKDKENDNIMGINFVVESKDKEKDNIMCINFVRIRRTIILCV